VKILQAAAALQGHEGQAVIVLSTLVDTAPEEARSRLSQGLLELNQLPTRLDQTNRQAKMPSNAGGMR